MNTIRRDILTMFLGIPAALAACTRPEHPALPDGEIVGAAMDVGHRLRQAANVEIPADKWIRKDIVIVGGGIAGLTAAWRLRQRGVRDFSLFELEREPGGTSRSGKSAVTAYPWGAHYVPVPLPENRALLSLLEEVSVIEGYDEQGAPVIAEQHLCQDPEERVFYRGRWYEGLYMRAGASRDDLAQLERFHKEVDRWVVWRDAKGRRAFTLPVAQCSTDAEAMALDRLSMAAWLDARGFTSPRLRWYVEYGCRDDYGLNLEQTSAWAALFYFAARMRAPGEQTQPFITWPEGNGRLVAHLANAAREHIRAGFAVSELIPRDNGVDVIAISHDGREALGIHARRVIFAAPQFIARYVIRPWREDPPPHLADFRYSTWMVANLHLRERPAGRGFPLSWDNVLYESPALGYVHARHQQDNGRGPTVITWYYPMLETGGQPARQRLQALSREQCADIALTDLQRAHPDIRELSARLDVMKWGHAMIAPRVGFIGGQARRQATRPYRGIHFAHSDLSGMALFEEAFYQGMRGADEMKSEE
ncbi:MAG: FAD-dependent oxidoreductase [Blastocatellia bacterium]